MSQQSRGSQLDKELHGLGTTDLPHAFPEFNPIVSDSASESEEFNPFNPHDLYSSSSEALRRPPTRSWTPIPLRKWFAVSLLAFIVLVGIVLEVVLHLSNMSQGWDVANAEDATSGITHYIYTLPPVAATMIIVGLWTWTDFNIRKMQPYLDLARGNAPASRSMLLDYSSKHPLIVSVYAWHHSHYLVSLASSMVLIGLTMQPLAASIFTVKNTWKNAPNIPVMKNETLGLNPTSNNLTAFSTAAAFLQASVIYNLSPPNFILDIWAIAAIQVPRDKVENGTMLAYLPAVMSNGHCKAADTSSITPFTNQTGFTLSGSADSCMVVIPVTTTTTTEYGVDVVTCPNSTVPEQFKPVIFWTLTRQGLDPSAKPLFSLVYCTPTIELFYSAAQIALQTGNLQNATIVEPFTQPNNITDPNGTTKGRPFNGVAFDLEGTDLSTQDRAQASKAGLTSAIIQKAQQSPGGLPNQIQTSGIIGITESLYDLYLSLIARNVYFVPSSEIQEVGIMTFQTRIWMVGLTVHLMAAIIFIFAALGAGVHILHRRMRSLVILPRGLGTLASAAAFTAGSNVSEILDGNLDEEALTRVLQHKRFKIDRSTGRIVMEGEEGFDRGEELSNPRKSLLVQLRDRVAM